MTDARTRRGRALNLARRAAALRMHWRLSAFHPWAGMVRTPDGWRRRLLTVSAADILIAFPLRRWASTRLPRP